MPVNVRSTIINYRVTKKIDAIPTGAVSPTSKRVNVGVSWVHRGNLKDYVVSGVVTESGVH
jgi:hypothetical protein